MARFASVAKMGFYATPLSVVESIKNHLKFPDGNEKIEGLRLIDPCCGEGVSLSTIAKDKSSASIYGNELQNERYAKASEKLEHVLRCDALAELKTTTKAYSLLWLNPPYDNAGDGERLEVKFLEAYSRLLTKNGLLVYIIPASSLRASSNILLPQYKNINVYSFPKEEYESFKQIVVMAQKGLPHKDKLEENKQYLDAQAYEYYANRENLYEVIPDTDHIADDYAILPSKVSNDRFRFFSNRLDKDEMYSIATKSKLFDQFIGLTVNHSLNTNIQPLTSLRKGHLAMLLAGGFLNGEIEKNGKRYCIKGNVFQSNNLVDHEIDRNGDVKQTYKTHYDIVINMYDYQNNEFKEIKA